MTQKHQNAAKADYQRLRNLSCAQLWADEVPLFNQGHPRERMQRVSVVRAIGVVFSESGTAEEKSAARQWLRQLLHDPEEKIRRYAMTALPKIGADDAEENTLLDLLEKTDSNRELRALGQTLAKIGGEATLDRIRHSQSPEIHRTIQKVEGTLARLQNPSAIRMDHSLDEFRKIRIHLRCKFGLEEMVTDELQSRFPGGDRFRIIRTEPGLVAVDPLGPFELKHLFSIRTFANAAIVLGTADSPDNEAAALAKIIASEHSQRVFHAFTDGPIRYRLEFPARGHQRALIRSITNRVFELCPTLINDSRSAPWQIAVYQRGRRIWAELSPRLRPDPRFAYRLDDVPAASHPPLAAAMAFLAGSLDGATVWDPFCGSGLELVEAGLRGGASQIIGTDRSEDAVRIASANFESALHGSIPSHFEMCDFRDYSDVEGLREGGVSVIISNPPMGRRIKIPDLRGLIADFFEIAAEALAPSGCLVFANPLPLKPLDKRLILDYRHRVDLGGFDVHLEKYTKAES
jgi:predicted RNA methylase